MCSLEFTSANGVISTQSSQLLQSSVTRNLAKTSVSKKTYTTVGKFLVFHKNGLVNVLSPHLATRVKLSNVVSPASTSSSESPSNSPSSSPSHSPSNSPNTDNSSSSGLSKGALAGIVLGGLVAIAAVLAGILILLGRAKKRREAKTGDATSGQAEYYAPGNHKYPQYGQLATELPAASDAELTASSSPVEIGMGKPRTRI